MSLHDHDIQQNHLTDSTAMAGSLCISTCENKYGSSSDIFGKAQGRPAGADASASGVEGHLLHQGLADAIDNVQARAVEHQLVVLCLGLQQELPQSSREFNETCLRSSLRESLYTYFILAGRCRVKTQVGAQLAISWLLGGLRQ